MTDTDPYVGAELVAVLPSADLDRGELWYGRLGFAVVASYPGERILRAGSLHLHLRHQPDTDPTTAAGGVYLYLASASVLHGVHTAWAAAGARIITAPEEQPYGLVEFATEDLDGNLWRVGAPAVDEHPTAPTPHDADAEPEPAEPLGTEAAIEVEVDWYAVVVEDRCDRCGPVPPDGPATVASRIRSEAHLWTTVLRPADDDLVRARPAPSVWSALEYAAHVRDGLSVATERVLRTLAETDPDLDAWDHEATMADGFANESDRESVGDDLTENAGRLAEVLGRVSGDQWERTAGRGDGARATVALLARMALHELVHHRIDAQQSLAQASDPPTDH